MRIAPSVDINTIGTRAPCSGCLLFKRPYFSNGSTVPVDVGLNLSFAAGLRPRTIEKPVLKVDESHADPTVE